MTGTSVHKSGGSLVLALGCGCTDSHSVSVSNTFSAGHISTPRRRLPAPCSADDALSLPSPSSSYDDPRANPASSPSFSELLRQLKSPAAAADVGRDREKEIRSRASRLRVEESVVVVKETVDPLGEFRRSMLHMILEKDIAGGAELRALLRRFLLLNSPCHHAIILRAFADVWEEVFSGGQKTSAIDLFPRPQRHSSGTSRVYASLKKHCTLTMKCLQWTCKKERKQNQTVQAASATMLFGGKR